MNCKQAKEQFLDLLAADAMPTGSPVGSHVAGCAECAAALASLKSTMAMLDEWKAPASSAYFNTRLRAKLAEVRREEAMPRSWASRIWTPAFLRPALVAAMGLAFVVGMNFYQPKVTNQSTNKVAGLQKGTAVADLQALETNHDLYADFDLLDDIGSNHAPVAETTNQGPGSQL
jgi:hypothetical protein